MAIWLVRAGRTGENQDFAIESNVAVIGWDDMPDLASFTERDQMVQAAVQAFPEAKPKKITNWVSQLWAFAKRTQEGDIVVLPLKGLSTIAFGRVAGPYEHHPQNPPGSKHTLPVSWNWPDVPRDRFDQDILYSFGACMTVCRIKRNNAEARVMAVLGGKAPPPAPAPGKVEDEDEATDIVAAPDLEQYADDQIRNFIARRFAGHDLARLVSAILNAQGYKTETAPPGPDGGVDIIAGRGPMGFDPPRLCVQVKATANPQDVRVIRELKGVMKDFNADQGLFVSWSGFKRSVLSEARRQYFEIRLWDAGDVVQHTQKHYDQFPEELKADLPLKRIWTLVQEDDE